MPPAGQSRWRQNNQPDDHPLPLLQQSRIVKWGDQWYIAVENLEQFEEYYDAQVGDIIRVKSKVYGGEDLFFELAGRVPKKKPGDIDAFWIIRIDPETEFADLPVTTEHRGDG